MKRYYTKSNKAETKSSKSLRRLIRLSISLIVLVFVITSYFILVKRTSAAGWWPDGGNSWKMRKALTITNNSAGNLSSGSTIAITIDTKSLYDAGKLQSDCDDIRILYQPNSSTATEVTRHLIFPSGTTCSTSTSTKVNFKLQSALNTTISNTTDYYMYYSNSGASTPSSTDNAFDTTSSIDATLICPFDGTTTCVAGETPSTESGAVRYSGSKSAMSFDGINDFVKVSHNSSVKPTTAITFETWFNAKNISTNNQLIISSIHASSGIGLRLNNSGVFTASECVAGELCGIVRIGAGYRAASYPISNLSSNTWYHVATTFDGSAIKLYVDGTLVDTLSVTGTISQTTEDICFGAEEENNNCTSDFFKGFIDEVRISDTVRYTSNFTPSAKPFVRDSNTKLLLHFDENGDDPRNTGKNIDDSGNSNHGTITGAKYISGLIGVDNGTSDTGNVVRQSYTGHEGIFIEEGTTNLITNPSFDHTTYNTHWDAIGANLTPTENTTLPYYKFGSKSRKLVASATAISGTSNMDTIGIDPNSTATHTLSFYAYDGTTGNIGGTVSSSIVKPVWEGVAQSGGTYTDMGGGWWRVTYATTTTDQTNEYGFEVQVSKTVYIDGVQLEAKAYATTYTDGTLGTGYSWSGTAHESASSRTAADLRFATSGNVSGTTGSISLWYYIDNPESTNSRTLFDATSNGSNQIFAMRTRPQLAQGYVQFFWGSGTSVFGGTVTNKRWQHVTITYTNGGNATLYVNGVSVGTPTGYSTMTLGTSMYVGLNSSFRVGGEIPLNSKISDFRVYDSVLSSTQVADLYYSGLVSHSQGTQIDRFGGGDTRGENPIATYHIDEGYGTTTYDSTLNANNLTITGPTWDATNTNTSSNRRISLKFDGTNDYVTRTTDGDFDFGTGAFTVGGWFKHPSTVSGTDTILARYGSAGYKVYMNSSGYVCFAIDDDSTWTPDDSACSTVSYADSKWHYFSAVKIGTTSITLYVDGNQVGQDATIAATGTLNTGSPLYLGIDSDGTSNPWDGFLDDVTVYGYARSTAQIYTDIAGGQKSAVMGASTKDSLSEGLVGYWKMDENTANTCTGGTNDSCDSSGNANDGAWNGDVAATTGKFGNGTTYDGTGDYISLSSSISSGTEHTISFWMNSSYTSSQILVGGSGSNWVIWSQSSSNLYYSQNGTTANLCNPGGHVDGTWRHITVTRKDTNVKFFNNGLQVCTITLANNTTQTINAIGSRGDGTTNYDGRFDDFRVYNRTLSPAEVQQLYSFAPGPVGYWKMDENTGQSMNDISGNDNTGNIGDTTSSEASDATWTTGKYGSALQSNGTSTWSEIPDTDTIDFAYNKDFSVGFWVKNIGGGTDDAIVEKWAGSGGYPYAFRYGAGNSVRFVRYDSSVFPLIDGTKTINDSAWHYIAGVKDGSTLRLYIDGVADGTVTDTTTGTTTNSSAIYLGMRGDGNEKFNGSVDDVKIYNYARTSGQIIEDMNASHPLGGSPVGSQVGYWKFDEGQGTTANNSGFGGSALNGTLTSMASPATATSGWTNGGKFGKGLLFDGTNDYVNLSSPTNFDNLSVADFTVSAWVKKTSLGSDKMIMGKTSSGGGSGWYLRSESTNNLHFNIDGSTDGVAKGGSIADGAWHHIVAVLSSNSPKIYLDGKQITYASQTSLVSPVDDSAQPLNIGASNTLQYWGGSIDEVKVYNAALSPAEILIDYNRGSSIKLGSLSDNSTYQKDATNQEYCVPGDSTSCASPLGEWKMDEASWTNDCSTNTVFDTSGNANHGDSCPNTTGPTGGTIPGRIGKAGTLDGTDEYVDLYDTMNASLSTTYTVSAWIKTTTVGEANVVASYRSTSSATPIYFQMDHNNADARFVVRDGAGNIATASYASALTTNTWYHLTGVRNGNTTRIYVNGVEGTSATATFGTISHNKAIIGGIVVGVGSTPQSTTLFKGAIDNLRIYNYVRTPAQIAWEYNRGAPLAHYKLDECSGSTANNSISSSYPGTITIGATGSNTSTGTCSSGTSTEAWNNGTSGKWNSSLDLDGTDDYIQISDSAPLRFDASNVDFSLFAWVKRTTTGTEYIISKEDADNDGYRLQFNSSDQVLCSEDATDVTSTSTITDTNWHLVGCTIDRDGNGQIYIDGKANGSTVSMGTDAMATTSAIRIGTRSYTSTSYLNGQIDDVRLYNYALTAGQVRNLFNEGASVRFGPASGNP